MIKLISGQAAAQMYFVFVYCELTLLIPAIDRLARSKHKYIGFMISPIEIIVCRLIPLIMGIPVNRYLSAIMSISCAGWFTYYYLGYMLGNGLINVEIPKKKLIVYLTISVFFQVAEGYWYFTMGEINCGTQLKLSAILTGTIFMLLSYNFCFKETCSSLNIIKLLGDNSFAIFFSHIAVMDLLSLIPFYKSIVVFPVNGIIAIVIDLLFIRVGKKLLGNSSKYLAL